MPVHFTAGGQPDGWAGRWYGTLLIPTVSGAVWLILAFVVPRIEPRRDNLIRSQKAYGTAWVALTVVLVVSQYCIIASAFGAELNAGRLIPAAVGGLFVVLGNLLGKIRWNYTFGIRTPWTLADEDVWDKTHRFAGWVFVLAGILLFGTALVFRQGAETVTVLLVGIAVTVLLPTVKSYLLWRDKNRGLN